MATFRIHQDDQENRIAADLRGRGKENHAATATAAAAVTTQTQVLHQTKRTVLGVLQNNYPRNGTKSVRRAPLLLVTPASVPENGNGDQDREHVAAICPLSFAPSVNSPKESTPDSIDRLRSGLVDIYSAQFR